MAKAIEFTPYPTNKFKRGDKVQMKNLNGNWERKIRTVSAVPGELNTSYAVEKTRRGNYQLNYSEFLESSESGLRVAPTAKSG